MNEACQPRRSKKGRTYQEAYGDIEDDVMKELIKVKRLKLNETESFISPEIEIMATNENTNADSPVISHCPSYSDSENYSRQQYQQNASNGFVPPYYSD